MAEEEQLATIIDEEKEETQLATIDKKEYPVLVQYKALAGDLEKVSTIIRENLGGQTITPFSLDRITIPTGGATNWEIPDLMEGTISAKSFHGIILHFTHGRSFWAQGLDEGASPVPPDCVSDDLEFGHGDPGGPCISCPFNQWDSGHQGRGKACKEKMMIFLLRENTYIPQVIQVPTMSIKVVKAFMLRLASEGIPYYSVVPEFTLKKTQQTGGGLTFSQMVISIKKNEENKGEMLNDLEIKRLLEAREHLAPILHSSYQRAQEENDYLNDE